MDVAAYLRKQREHLDRQTRQVRDFSVFDFGYIPDQPLMRPEARQLIQAMLRFELSGIPNHHAVIGSRGSGKTLTLKHLRRVVEAETKLEVAYANCRQHNTSFKILAHLLSVAARGASLAELYDRFCCQYPDKTVVVLDEVDLMSPKDRRREILYLLSRSENPYMVIMLSNNPRVLKELDAATISSLQPVPLYFRNYNADQFLEIIRDRASKGLHTWDEGQLAEIAGLSVRLANSDARVAIKSLQYAVTEPETALRESFERARQDTVVDMVNDLSDSNLTILEAASTSRSDLAKDIYLRYCQMSQSRGEKPFSYMYFYSNLSYLQSLGLVALVSTKLDRTYANRAVLTFDQGILSELCRLRFGE